MSNPFIESDVIADYQYCNIANKHSKQVKHDTGIKDQEAKEGPQRRQWTAGRAEGKLGLVKRAWEIGKKDTERNPQLLKG